MNPINCFIWRWKFSSSNLIFIVSKILKIVTWNNHFLPWFSYFLLKAWLYSAGLLCDVILPRCNLLRVMWTLWGRFSDAYSQSVVHLIWFSLIRKTLKYNSDMIKVIKFVEKHFILLNVNEQQIIKFLNALNKKLWLKVRFL